MKWVLRLLRLYPRANGSAEAHREAEAKLRVSRARAPQVRREADRFARTIDDALRGRA